MIPAQHLNEPHSIVASQRGHLIEPEQLLGVPTQDLSLFAEVIQEAASVDLFDAYGFVTVFGLFVLLLVALAVVGRAGELAWLRNLSGAGMEGPDRRNVHKRRGPSSFRTFV